MKGSHRRERERGEQGDTVVFALLDTQLSDTRLRLPSFNWRLREPPDPLLHSLMGVVLEFFFNGV